MSMEVCSRWTKCAISCGPTQEWTLNSAKWRVCCSWVLCKTDSKICWFRVSTTQTLSLPANTHLSIIRVRFSPAVSPGSKGLKVLHFLSTRQGVTVSYKKSDAETSDSILFVAKTSKFAYHGEEINSDIFDALLLDDIAKRSKFFSPGYLSSGGKPCEFDSMTDEQLRPFGMKKSSCGFKGTVRCYIERNRGRKRILCSPQHRTTQIPTCITCIVKIRRSTSCPPWPCPAPATWPSSKTPRSRHRRCMRTSTTRTIWA